MPFARYARQGQQKYYDFGGCGMALEDVGYGLVVSNAG